MTVVTLLALAALGAFAWWAWQKSRRPTHPVPPGHKPDVTIPHEQELELYHNALSLCSMKSRVCLAELGIPYESHPIDLIETGAYENIRPHFLAVNPGGTVPVLVHDGHPVYESHLQIRYAPEHAPPGADAGKRLDPDLAARAILAAARRPAISGLFLGGNVCVPGLLPKAFAFAGMIVPSIATRMMRRILFEDLQN